MRATTLWNEHPKIVVGLAAALLLTGLASSWAKEPLAASAAEARPALPVIEQPLAVRRIAPAVALTINRSIPFSTAPNSPAKPFRLRGDDSVYTRALDCLTAAIYYEAATEAEEGQRAVAQVVLNRVRHPAFEPSVCGVIYQGSLRETGCQFSFTCDGSMRRPPLPTLWSRARELAGEALRGSVHAPVGLATHYHAAYVVPYWATSLAKNQEVGTHIFYRWPGWWGQKAAFARRHSGEEADPRLLKLAALQRHGGAAALAGAEITAEQLMVGVDPRVELISIVQFLAAKAPAGEESPRYQREVREHFGPYSDHLAVQIYRQLAEANGGFSPQALSAMLMHHSPPPTLKLKAPLAQELASSLGGKRKVEGFLEALRDFAAHSKFSAFYRRRAAYYEQLEAQSRNPALDVVRQLVRDGDPGALQVNFVLAPLLANASLSGCRPGEADPEPWALIAAGHPQAKPFAEPVRVKTQLSPASRAGCDAPQNEGRTRRRG